MTFWRVPNYLAKSRRCVWMVWLAIVLFITFTLLRYPLACHWERERALRHYFPNDPQERHGIPQDALPILMPICHRLEYLRNVLDALPRMQDAHQVVLVLSQDCNDPEIRAYLQQWTREQDVAGSLARVVWMSHHRPFFGLPSLVWNSEYATAANIRFLLEFAFEYLEAKGAIVLESDLVPSVDFYAYHRWAFQWFLNRSETSGINPETAAETGIHPSETTRSAETGTPINKDNVLTVSSFRMESRSDANPYTVEPGVFVVWGWSTSRYNWDRWIRPSWTLFGSWDHVVQWEARQANQLICVQPELSRVRNIGRMGINFRETDDTRWSQNFGAVFIRQGEEGRVQYVEPGNGSEKLVAPVMKDWDLQGFCERASVHCKER